MARGISIHIGLNQFDPVYYGYNGKLSGCENDAKAMQSIAERSGYEPVLLLSQQASAINVLRELSKAAESLNSGDILLLTYAGHGSQVPDADGDEDDEMDETLCLYDRMLVDDELYRMWSQFQAGVRIFMISDSCHSGTMAKFYGEEQAAIKPLLTRSEPKIEMLGEIEEPVYRVVPLDVATKVYRDNRAKYDEIQWSGIRSEWADIDASVLVISACQDNQTAADGLYNGLFTSVLLDVWNEGNFRGSYYSFYKQIVSHMPPIQAPRYYKVGAVNQNFEKEKPFTIQKGESNMSTTSTDNSSSKTVEDRLAELKASRQAKRKTRQQWDDDKPGKRWDDNKPRDLYYFTIEIPRDIIDNLADEQVYDFLQNDGSDLMMTAYLNDRGATLPRGGEGTGTIECTANSKGEIECKATAKVVVKW